MAHTDLLFELVKSKEGLSKDGVIGISLGEIAEVWSRKNVVHERNLPPSFEQFFGHDYIDPGFLGDVTLAMEKLTEEKKIIFEKLGRAGLENSLSSISRLQHIGDRIYLRMGEAAGETVADKNKTLAVWLTFYTKDNVKLEFNTRTGDFKLGEVKGNLVPDTQPFKVFLALLEDDGHQVKDTLLLKILYPDKAEFSKIDRWSLNEILRNIKIGLGILPNKGAKNKTIFLRLRKWQGYKLDLKTETE